MKFRIVKLMLLKTIIVLIALLKFGDVKAQSDYKISGVIRDDSSLPLSFATVAVYNQQDSALINGTITDADGKFEVPYNKAGDYWLTASFIGYEPLSKKIIIQKPKSIDVGVLVMQQSSIQLSEALVVGERTKARQDLDKTIFYVNKKMRRASNTGIDMVKLVPGVQVDLLHNISLEGKQNVLVMVNGIERDASYLNQLNSDNIDKIEIETNPGTKYSSEISGIINIILKKDQMHGVNGHIYAEIPVNYNEVYSFPSVSINYNYKRINIFSSYNGEFSYFNIDALNSRNVLAPNHQFEISKQQYIRQKNWSHKFNLGLDYFLDDKNQFNFYGFINPYSNEFDGNLALSKTVGNEVINSVEYTREDKDKNLSTFASAYYKHLFDKPGKEFEFEVNYYGFNAQNSTYLSNNSSDETIINTLQPSEKMFNVRFDLSLPIKAGLKMEAGIKESVQILSDDELPSFNYQKIISAGYASLFYTKTKFQVNAGFRVENAFINSSEIMESNTISILPNFTAKYDLSGKSSLKLSYRKSLERANVYQLNPMSNYIDPYTSKKGNPLLDPVAHHDLSLDYSILINNNFISIGSFYSLSTKIIENMSILNKSLLFETSTQNLGNISRFGLKLLGSLKPYKNITFNPFIKVYNIQTHTNQLAKANNIKNKNLFALESGLSLTVLFKYDIALSVMYKYNSVNAKIQNNYFDDVLYFISLDKTFFKNLKIGITSAIPLKRSFTYQGYESANSNFNVYSEDNIKMSVFPLWFKIKYSFASGKKVKRINRTSDFNEKKIKKGF